MCKACYLIGSGVLFRNNQRVRVHDCALRIIANNDERSPWICDGNDCRYGENQGDNGA